MLVASKEAELDALLDVPDAKRGIARARDGDGSAIEDLETADSRDVASEDMQAFTAAR